MTDVAQWQEHNDAYVTAALAWLRLRLTAKVAPAPPLPAPPAPDSGRLFWRRNVTTRLVAPPSQPLDHELAAAADAMLAAEATDPPPAFVLLSRALGLSRFEQHVLLLCVAMELDPRIYALCARAHDDPSKTYPTFALALTVFDEAAWDALTPDRPLRHLRLIEINQPGALPLTASPLRADEHIVDYVKGLHHLDNRLSMLLTPVEESVVALPLSQQTLVDAALAQLQVSVTPDSNIVALTGRDTAGKLRVAACIAAACNRRLYYLPAENVPAQLAEIETFARLWQRESLLLPIALYIDAHEVDAAGPEIPEQSRAAALRRLLAHAAGLVFVGTREPWLGLDSVTTTIDVAKPVPVEQRAAWIAVLGDAAGEAPALLGGQYDLDTSAIEHIARSALAEPNAVAPLEQRLWELCRVATRPRVESLAERLDPRATWDDIVLSDESLGLLRAIAEQVRRRARVYDEWGFRVRMNRGLGISALFTGESGTGKTMAAEVIANDLKLDLYRIDLSAVVSKYIGETEKNLRRLFDAADDGGAILFFDEADALFGKRSEVKDSHDRYANIEINYLLQRMEAYRGLAILATNMKSALDSGFMRRLRFIVTFTFPGPAERAAIWRRAFPVELPTDQLDWDWLARLSLSGGSIQAIALNAAFMAAAHCPPRVTMPLVLDAARIELRKLERPINENELAWHAPVGVTP